MKQNSKSERIRILIIDDHPVMRKGLAALINDQKDTVVCGEADNAHNAITAIRASKCDLAIVDLSLGETSGIELLKNIKNHFPSLLTLVHSMHDETVFAQRALHAGASGYLMKGESPDKLIPALRKVLGGNVALSDNFTKRMLNTMGGGRPVVSQSPIEQLSDREIEVFALIGQGFGTRAISERLHLSIKTIESHRAHIKEKLNLHSATELVHHAIQWVQSEALPSQSPVALAASN